MTEILDALPGFTFGCDPELFVVNSDGEFVSAEGLIPGTKEEPFVVNKGAVQVDGMAAEFNIDPASSYQEFNDNIITVLAQLKKMLPTGYRLVPSASVTFSEKVWESASQKSKELGCSPDYNAWTGEVNPPPENTSNPRLRTASGHIHVGWTQDADTSDLQHIINCQDLTKQLDWYLGLWSLTKDADENRRLLYGKAGACRYKPYGVEYRVLSNFWVTYPSTRKEVWNRLQAAIRTMRSDFLPETKANFNELLIETINNSKRSSDFFFTFPVKNFTKMI